MSKLILVKHSLPDIVPGIPASRWALSDEGRRRCGLLASRLDAWRPAVLVSSAEPKALETARLLAEAWNLPLATRDGFEEQHRETAPFLAANVFRESIRAFFEKPAELVFGEETADEAYARFAAAMDTLLDEHPGDSVMVVTHGTVIALYVARRTGVDAFELWQRLDLPDAIVLDRRDRSILTEMSRPV